MSGFNHFIFFLFFNIIFILCFTLPSFELLFFCFVFLNAAFFSFHIFFNQLLSSFFILRSIYNIYKYIFISFFIEKLKSVIRGCLWCWVLQKTL